MSLKGIEQFLERYKKVLLLENNKKEEVINIIKTETGIILKEKQITISKGEITLQVTSVIKNELFLHEKNIFTLLQQHTELQIHKINY